MGTVTPPARRAHLKGDEGPDALEVARQDLPGIVLLYYP